MKNIQLNKTMSSLCLSPIVSISEEANRKAKQFKEDTGKDFLFFQRGDIDRVTPQYIINAATKAMNLGYTKYPKSGGEPVLKDAIINKLARYNKVPNISMENICVTYGGQEALQLSFKLFEGQTGTVFTPCWSCVLENISPYNTVDLKQLPLVGSTFDVDYDLLDMAVRNSSFLYLNSPQNPTGKVFSEEEVTKIVETCAKYGTYVISDEAYEHIIFDDKKHFSPLSLDYDRVLAAYTFSKSYAMTGWRLGYVVSRNKEIVRMLRMSDYTQSGAVVTFLQHAGAEALNNVEEARAFVDNMVGEFKHRRDVFYDGLSQIDGITLSKPEGTFYLFPSFENLIPNGVIGEDFDTYIYKKLMSVGIVSIYGSCFGEDFPDCVRLCLSMSNEREIEEAIDRMTRLFS